MKHRPHAGHLPITEPTPAGHARTASLARQHIPRDARAQHEDDPSKAARSSHRSRPPFGFGSSAGNNGSIAVQRWSDARGLPITPQPTRSSFVSHSNYCARNAPVGVETNGGITRRCLLASNLKQMY